MASDPEFMGEKEAALGPYPVLLGDDLDQAVRTLVETDPGAIEWMKSWLSEEYDAQF